MKARTTNDLTNWEVTTRVTRRSTGLDYFSLINGDKNNAWRFATYIAALAVIALVSIVLIGRRSEPGDGGVEAQ